MVEMIHIQSSPKYRIQFILIGICALVIMILGSVFIFVTLIGMGFNYTTLIIIVILLIIIIAIWWWGKDSIYYLFNGPSIIVEGYMISFPNSNMNINKKKLTNELMRLSEINFEYIHNNKNYVKTYIFNRKGMKSKANVQDQIRPNDVTLKEMSRMVFYFRGNDGELLDIIPIEPIFFQDDVELIQFIKDLSLIQRGIKYKI